MNGKKFARFVFCLNYKLQHQKFDVLRSVEPHTPAYPCSPPTYPFLVHSAGLTSAVAAAAAVLVVVAVVNNAFGLFLPWLLLLPLPKGKQFSSNMFYVLEFCLHSKWKTCSAMQLVDGSERMRESLSLFHTLSHSFTLSLVCLAHLFTLKSSCQVAFAAQFWHFKMHSHAINAHNVIAHSYSNTQPPPPPPAVYANYFRQQLL